MGPAKEGPWRRKYIVRLTDVERETLRQVIRSLKGSSQKVMRAQILLKADADGPAWTDMRIAEAFGCRTKTVENVRQRLVLEGFEVALHGKRPESPPRQPVLDGEQQAKVIAMRLSRRLRALPIGRCDCWPRRSWSCRSSSRSVTRPFDAR
jgi:hypothetical protein